MSSRKKTVAAAYGLSAVIVSVVLALVAVSPAERSSADPPSRAGTTSTTAAGEQAGGDFADADADGLIYAEDPCPDDARNTCFGAVAVDGITGNPVRINAGSHATVSCARAQLDCAGEQWLADFGFRDAGALAGCPDTSVLGSGCRLDGAEDLFRCDDAATQRIFRCGHRPKNRKQAIAYEFDVAPGTYLLNLFFAAGAARSPDRVGASGSNRRGAFGATIVANGETFYSRFDPADVAETGAIVVRSVVVEAQEAGVVIELHGVRRRTALRALELLAATDGVSAGDARTPDDRAARTSTGGAPAAAVVGDDDNDGLVGSADPCPTDARNRCAGPIATDSASGKQIRVNANVSSAECSGSKTDCAGNVWNGDFGYNLSAKAATCNLGGGGEACVIGGITALFGCDDESTEDLFQCEHSDAAGGAELSYGFAVANGRYVVNLFFANTFTGTTAAGSRTFDVRIEGATVYNDFDQIVAAGGSAIAVVRAAVVTVSDGNGLQIEFGHVVENPTIKAIEVFTYPTGCTTATQCNDNNPCTNDACTSGACTNVNNTAACTNDGNACTNDVCSGGACTHPNNTAACNDSLTCTTNDVCSAGVCRGTSTCPAGQTCEAGSQCVGAGADGDNDGLGGAGDPCPTDARNLCAGPVATDTATAKKIRLNANVSSAECSGTKTDCTGGTWLADFGYNQSGRASTCNLGGGGEGCVITGITAIFGCEDESTEDLFQCDHYDVSKAPPLIYSFSVPNGRYVVNSFFANTYGGTAAAGSRVFDVKIEGALAYDNFDQVAAAGGSGKAIVRSAVVDVTDGNGLQIEFGHEVENPAVKALEVLAVSAASCTSAAQCNDGKTCTTDTCSSGTCVNTPNTLACNDGVACTSGDVCGGGVCQGTSNCAAGQTCNTNTGTCGTAQISFGKSTLSGASLVKPTSLQFGPDGKLYVAQQDGLIKIYTVTRSGPNAYSVTATQTITSVQSLPNRNDDGVLNPGVTKRLVTGLLVAGTAGSPVIYVASSDPRIGGGDNGVNTNLDTNSGILSRLTWNGSQWVKLDLVRGLPRSEENHHANGMVLNTATNTLYLTQGGNTNEGATSNNYLFVPEFALSAAILSINLTAIGNTTYDLPTLDDETRAGNPDANDPFGGNDGKNQARIVAGGPVQVFSPGWRNPYDVVVTKLGKMYSVDNGANAGWGDIPVGNGTPNCTNGVHEPGHTFPDSLHLITGQGYYGGHPNPTRGNINNKFNASNPQSPVPASNVVECTFKEPGVSNGALATFTPSTNGLTEYSASSFAGQMKGDLLAAGWDNRIYRVDLNSTGTAVNSLTVLFSSVAPNSKALDLVAQGDAGPFPGSIWATEYNGGTIIIYEPDDVVACGGQDSTTLDDDGDGYDNADEIDNGTSPCSSGDTPPDADSDHDSNLNDADDDNDGLLDTGEPFARDAQNGKGTNLPVIYSWENSAPNPGGILNLGFTGLMTNGVHDYEALFNPDDMTVSGAAGVLTIDLVDEGDALAASNTQRYGFQFGINVGPASGVFTAHTRIISPFAGVTPQNFQSMGLFVGTGRQTNYVKLTTSANGGIGGVGVTKEVNEVVTAGTLHNVAMPGPEAVDLYLAINPGAATVQGYYRVTDGGVTGGITTLGAAVSVPASWFSNATFGLAVGIISTSRGSAPPFPATWDFIDVTPGPPTCEDPDGDAKCDASDPCPDDGLDDADADGICAGTTFNAPKTGAGDNCPNNANANQADSDSDGRGNACDLCPTATGAAEDACLGTGAWTTLAPSTIARSEVGMASTGGKNYLMGGQQSGSTALEIYDPATNTWTTGPSLPSSRHHIQPVVVKGKIYVIGGLTGFPGPSLNSVLMFDPANAAAGWQTRANLPTTRGAAGCAADGVKIYCAGGLSSSAGSTAINVMEVYNTVSNTWAALAPMPRERDHFQAVVINGKFYAMSGRDTTVDSMFAFSDVYDIATNTWSSAAPMPTPRGGYSAAVLQGRLIAISGEGGGDTFPEVEEYDPVRDVWRALADIPTSRHGTGAAVNTAPDGVARIYVTAGGPNQGGSKSTVNQVFEY